jgi:hypothetical protein
VQQAFVLQQRIARPQVCLACPCSRHSLVMLGAGEPGGRAWLEIISRTIAAIHT